MKKFKKISLLGLMLVFLGTTQFSNARMPVKPVCCGCTCVGGGIAGCERTSQW